MGMGCGHGEVGDREGSQAAVTGSYYDGAVGTCTETHLMGN